MSTIQIDAGVAAPIAERRGIPYGGLLALGLVLAASAFLYAGWLDYMPATLGWDEVYFALQGHSLATTGRETHGEFLPLYFHFTDRIFYQPMIQYATAAAFTLLPVTEVTLRIPTALIALLDIALIYFVALKIFKSERLAVLTALLFAATPAHVIHSRMAADFVYPHPFILVWLWCLAEFVERPRPWLIAAGSAALGVGFYGYVAAVAMMPIYVAMTVVVVFATAPKPKVRYLAEIGLFLVMLVPVLIWFSHHPTAFRDQMARYAVYDTKRYSPLQGAKEFVSFLNLTHRIAMYWDYFGPQYLFMHSGLKPSISTRQAGVFLLPFVVFIPVGIHQAMNARRNWIGWLLVAGFVTAPLAALLVDEPFAIDRELNVLLFGVLLGTVGIARLMASPHRTTRALTVFLLLYSALDFKAFVVDYFTEHRERSARFFDDRNMRDGVEQIIEGSRGRDPAVYFSRDIENIESFWRFYLIKHDRLALVDKTTVFDPATLNVQALPAGTMLMGRFEDTWYQPQVQGGALRLVKIVRAIDGKETLVVLERRSS